MELNEDFREFIELLNNHHVRYMVVGGYSVAYHGYPRYTGDIDIWIEPTTGNSLKVVEVLEEFGFGDLSLTENDFNISGKVIQFGVAPLRIDMLTSVDGLPDFDLAYQNSTVTLIDNTLIRFIGYSDLITNKQNTNRTIDKSDVEELKKINRGEA